LQIGCIRSLLSALQRATQSVAIAQQSVADALPQLRNAERRRRCCRNGRHEWSARRANARMNFTSGGVRPIPSRRRRAISWR